MVIVKFDYKKSPTATGRADLSDCEKPNKLGDELLDTQLHGVLHGWVFCKLKRQGQNQDGGQILRKQHHFGIKIRHINQSLMSKNLFLLNLCHLKK